MNCIANCGVGRTKVGFFRAHFLIRFHVRIRICYLTYFFCSEEQFFAVVGVFHVFLVDKSDCTSVSGDLGCGALSFSASKIGLSFSRSHAIPYKSSCLMHTSGSGFHFRGVTRVSCRDCCGLN